MACPPIKITSISIARPLPCRQRAAACLTRTMAKHTQAPLTMTDIARLADVSESTISRALANSPLVSRKTRERIQALALEHGYTVNPIARNLRSRTTRTIAVVIPLVHERDQHLSDPFFATILGHLADALTSRGYDLLLSKVFTHQDRWVEGMVQSQRADGVILIGQSLEHETINAAAEAGVPVVSWGAKMPGQAYTSVGSDNVAGGRLATQHLLKSGRKQVAFMGDIRLPEVAQRYEGYLAAHKAVKLKPNPALCIAAHFLPEEAYMAAQGLIASGVKFDGVVSASDLIAVSTIRALTENGQHVPHDVGVVGFDDISLASYTSPPLTTIRQDIAKGAKLLVDAVLATVAGQDMTSVEMAPELIVRGSSLV